MNRNDSESEKEESSIEDIEGVKTENNEESCVDNGEKSGLGSRAVSDQSTLETEKTASVSYEVFQGEFQAEKIQLYLPTKGASTSSELSVSDDASTSDDVSTICDEEIHQEKVMPRQVKSRYEDRILHFEDNTGNEEPATGRKTWRRPQSAGEIKTFMSEIHPSPAATSFNTATSKPEKPQKFGRLKRYSSTGDIESIGRQYFAESLRSEDRKIPLVFEAIATSIYHSKKRQLPSISNCKRLASSDVEDYDSSDSETIKEAPTPGDRKTLEAQFKLLYRENIQLDKAYGELQEKVRSKSPQLLTNRFLSPRELERGLEKKKSYKEIQQLQNKVEELESFISELQSAKASSPTSEHTEQYFKEKLQNLQKVKDDEIARLSEQVSYWLRQAYMQNANPAITPTTAPIENKSEKAERIADLEQTEAFLQCQIINLEDDLEKSRKHNDDLSEHCRKLENCLGVLDAEKSLLDALKKQNEELRKNLAKSEKNEQSLIEKLAQIAQENNELNQASSNVEHSRKGIKDTSQFEKENADLRNTCTSLKDRCAGLEDLKECLVHQIKAMEDEHNGEKDKQKHQVFTLNQTIRSLKEERDALLECKEQLELKQELNANMTKNLDKRIEDLQHHIGTLKSQLENQEEKLESSKHLQVKLDEISFEKGTIEALCSQYKSDLEILQKKLAFKQERLSDSFEQVNLQLIEETDEMATRQRDLLAENQVLKMRSCSRGFDAVIGRRFREGASPLIESCTKALYEIQQQIKRSRHDVDVFPPGYVESDLLDSSTMALSLSDDEAIKILDDYGEDVICTTVAELKHMEDQSPRLGDICTLAQLIRSVKESHQMTLALQKLKENAYVLRDHLEEEPEMQEIVPNPSRRPTPTPRDLSSPSLEGSASSRIFERQQLQEKVDTLQEELKTTKKVLQFLKEDNERLMTENERNKDANNLKKELTTLQANEKVLMQKLNKSQETCDKLVAQNRMLQEEKHELIKSLAELASLPELKKELEKARKQFEVAQKQNRILTDDLETMQKQLSITDKVLKDQVNALTKDLTVATKSEAALRASLDETRKAKEDLYSRYNELQEENQEIKDQNQEELQKMKSLLSEKDHHLRQLEEDLQQLKETIQLNIDVIASMKGRLDAADLEKEKLKMLLEEKTASLSETIQIRDEMQENNLELKLKLDHLESEKEEKNIERSQEIEDFKNQILNKDATIHEQEKSSKIDSKLLERLEIEMEEIKSRLEQTNMQLHELEEEKESASKDMEQYKKKCSDLENELRNCENKYAKIQSENEELASLLEVNQSTNQTDQSTIAELHEEIDDITKECQTEKELHQESKTKLDMTTLEMNEILVKNLQLMAELSDNKSTIMSLRKQINRLKNSDDTSSQSPLTTSAIDSPSAAEYDDHSSALPIHSNEIMSSELETLRNKCSALEIELSALKKGQEFILKAEHSNKTNVEAADSKVVNVDDSEKDRAPKTRQSSESDTASLKSTSSSDSSDTESMNRRPKPDKDRHILSALAQENQILKQKMNELQAAKTKQSEASNNESWLQQENKRLLDLLKEAESEAEDNQNERRKLEEFVDELRNKLNEHEVVNQQSGTESEPEAIYHERRRQRETEAENEIETLKHQLEETECLVVAHKNKLEYMENFNEDLKLANAKLKEEVRTLENLMKLPHHPVIEKIQDELKQQSMIETAPAVISTDAISTTPDGSWTEEETLPMDQIILTLCEKVKRLESMEPILENEKDNLSMQLQEVADHLKTSNKRNSLLEQQALNFTIRLEESHKAINEHQKEISDLEELLMKKDATGKEVIQSKEEDLDKFQEQLMTISAELEGKNLLLSRMEESSELQSEEHQQMLMNLQNTVNSLSQELEDKAAESVNLLNKTQFLMDQKEEIEEEIEKKNGLIQELKDELERLSKENADNLQSSEKWDKENQHLTDKLNSTVKMHDKTIEHLKSEIKALEQNSNQLKDAISDKDRSIGGLSGQLSSKEEEIETLSSRVEELQETEAALKMTMHHADDIIATREKEHLDEVEKLKNGLKRTISEVQLAEMSGEELITEINALEEKVKLLKAENESLKRKEDDVDNQIETIEIEKALLNTSLESEREEKGELTERYLRLTQENTELSDMLEKMQATIERLQSQMAGLHIQCDQHAQETREKELEIEQLSAEVSRLQYQCHAYSTSEDSKPVKLSHQGNNRDFELLEQELESARDEAAGLREMMSTLRMERDQLEREVQYLHLEYPSMFGSPLHSERKDVSEQTDPSDFISDPSYLQEDSYNELRREHEINSKLQEESCSLRSENEALRSKIASLEGSLNALSERLVPKLELGSIADESEPKQRAGHFHDDDTGRYVEDIETTRETGIMKIEVLEEKICLLEDARQKLSMQVEELNEVISDLNAALALKEDEVKALQDELGQVALTEVEWRDRYKEVQTGAKELRGRLQQAEEDNQHLQQKLVVLDKECKAMMTQSQVIEPGDMKQSTSDAIAQTLSIQEVIREIGKDRKLKRKTKTEKEMQNGKEDTDEDVSELTSSSSSDTRSSSLVNPVGSATQVTNLADDTLLQETILKERKESKAEAFNLEDVPEPVTESMVESSQAVITDQTSTSNNTVKSLQNELLGYQLMVEKLKRRNQELLESTGAVMTHDEKESLEREISALRGQVALLERNNRIFSDRERTDLKQDLDHANKRCNHLQSQLQAIKSSLEYEEMVNLKKCLQDSIKEANELKEKIRSYETTDSSDISEAESTVRQNKYARLLELEEEAEELKNKLDERDEDLKDRDVMIDELQHRMSNLKQQYEKEVEDLEKKNRKRERELQEEVKELEREVAEKKEMIQLKQANLRNKTDQLGECEMEIEKLGNDIKRKNKQIEQLKWEIESLKRENYSLQDRVDRLKHALSASSDSVLIDAGISPVGTFCSLPSPSSRIRSRASTPRSSFHENDGRSRMSVRSSDSPGRYGMDPDYHFRDSSRPRRAYSFDYEEESPTAALREGIHEAKEAVHQMGDVLDTPRMTPQRRRSPLPKMDLEGVLGTPLLPADSSSPMSKTSESTPNSSKPPRMGKRKTDKKNQQHSEKPVDVDEDTSIMSSSSESSDSSLSRQSSATHEKKSAEATSDKPLQFSILSLPSENSTRSLEKTGSTVPSKNLENRFRVNTFITTSSSDSSSDERKTFKSTKAPKKTKTATKSQTTPDQYSPNFVDLSKIDDPPINAEVKPHLQTQPKLLTSPQKSPKAKTADQIPELSLSSSASSGASTPASGLTPSGEGKTLHDHEQSFSPSKPFSKTEQLKPTTVSEMYAANHSSPESTMRPLSSSHEPFSTLNMSLLPDDRPTLIQEVTKAREEARKWFTEVTQSDRERRELGRRLEALENELMRLKNIEDSYEMMKKHQEDAEKVEDELKRVRAQVELANRKAEEARERNALLRAHLLDKEEIENGNLTLKQHLKPKKHHKSPLSELQERVVDRPLKTSPKPATEKQLKDIKDSFEYIAANFADMIRKSNQTAATEPPYQDKVSKLKRKCLERDQLLAKLVLKLRKRKGDSADRLDSSSFASSLGLESILTEADRAIRKDVTESDTSFMEDDIIPRKKHAASNESTPRKETLKHDSSGSAYSPISSLMKSLTSKSPRSDHSSPTHRIYIAKHDYAPSHTSMPHGNSDLPITHSLLPDLALLAGDTVVAIGNPDEREDGKLYQMAEVHGKIGFVPLSNLVPAEQVEGMQAYVQERGRHDRSKHPSSSPEKIVDLYKKLEQAHTMIADKMDRNSKPTSPAKTSQRRPVTGHFTPSGYTSDLSSHLTKEESRDDVSVTTETSTVKSYQHSRPLDVSLSKNKSSSKRHSKNRSRKDCRPKIVSSRSTTDVDNDVIRTSTPIDPKLKAKTSRHHRSSSLPPRRDSHSNSSRSGRSTPMQSFSSQKHPEESFRRGRSRSSTRTEEALHLSDSSFRSNSSSRMPVLTSPDPPTFLVIEKTMGQKSMIICWTPPLLDMISRSKNIPIIGYEISVDRKRKVQVSGAYTNKAILGDLDLKKTLMIEVRTVSSVGTLSTPCEVVFTPNPYSASPNPDRASTSTKKPASPRPKEKRSKKQANLTQSANVQRATALYDYDPPVDSPYKSHDNEVALRQGDDVILLGTPRPDGFCDVQVDGKRGLAPIAFLISSCDETTDDVAKPNDKLQKKFRHKKKNASSSLSDNYRKQYSSPDSSFQA